jgi:hypothetical protein
LFFDPYTFVSLPFKPICTIVVFNGALALIDDDGLVEIVDQAVSLGLTYHELAVVAVNARCSGDV